MATTVLLWDKFGDIDIALQEDVSDCVYKTVLGVGSPLNNPGGKLTEYLIGDLQRRASAVINEMKTLRRGSSLKAVRIRDFEEVTSGAYRIALDVVTDKEILENKTFEI